MHKLGRRTLLGSALALTGAGLIGCSVDTGSSSTPNSGSSGATNPSPGSSATSGATGIDFPSYSTKLESSGTVRWLDSGDLKSVFETAVLNAFTAKNPTLKNDYQGTSWDTVEQVLSLGLRNSSAPDIFDLPPTITSQTAIAQGWVRPLDDLIPDFDTWRKQWPATGLIPGIHVFNNKVYTFPLNSSRRLDKMLFVDTVNMKAAGYDDPIAQIKNWDDIYTALQKVVKTGKAGLMLGYDQLGATVQGLATTIGWLGALNGWAGMNMKTGQYSYDAPEVLEAFEFLQKLVTDKLVVPGFLTLLDADARTQFATGKTGMMFVGPYSLPAWKQQAPNWKYAVGQLPSQNGSGYVVPFAETGANNPWVYSKTKLPNAAGQILAYMGSDAGQKEMVTLSEGNLESLQEKANQEANRDGDLDANATICNNLAHKLMHTCPQVELRNADVAQVRLALKPVTPVWADVMAGIFTGDLKNPKAQFAKYNSALEQALDAAIAAAKKKGSTVTRDDFAFSNWNPNTDYTAADYKKL